MKAFEFCKRQFVPWPPSFENEDGSLSPRRNPKMHSRARLGNICAYSAETTVSRNPQWRTERRHLPAKIRSERGPVMQISTLRLRSVVWGCRLMRAAVALGLLLASVFAQSGFAQNASAQNNLNFANNYFVTGDYAVGGVSLVGKTSGGFATGTISIGADTNPGVQGTNSVPQGAQIVGAILYWQSIEIVGGATGQNGFFRPVFKGGPQTGYPIKGVILKNPNNPNAPVFWGITGCASPTATSKQLVTYRTDVRGYLPVDPATGNVLANGTYEVRLASQGSGTPLTMGATLVLIYRVINSPNFPLKAIIISDGTYAPTTTSLTTSMTINGFYDAAIKPPYNPNYKLTYIVGNGQKNLNETVSLDGQQLTSLYGNGSLPPFPGAYQGALWDNPTWIFPNASNPNPLNDGDASVSTMVTATKQGCAATAAIIFSTLVHDDSKDGILRAWKNASPPGYTDVATGQFVSLDDPLDEPKTSQQDVFIQMDHVFDANGDFTPDPLAISLVKNAFLANNHNVHLHINTGSASAHAIPEPAVMDGSPDCNGGLCSYPNQVGITSWRDGFEFVESQPLNYTQELTAQLNEADCEANSPPLAPNGDCIRRFPPAQRLSHHYVVFGDTLGAANWGLLGGTLTDSKGTGAGVVVQFNNTVTFYTSRGHGLTPDPNNNHVPNGRVTIRGAITNPNLNGTYLVQGVTCQVNPDPSSPNFNLPDCSVNNKALGPYSFTIQLASAGTPPPTVCPAMTPGGSSCYTVNTDPRLAIASGKAGSGSGFSDVGGAGTLVPSKLCRQKAAR